jgi:hypothetical protein
MPLKLNSSGGGSVTLDTPSTASTFTLTVPAITGTAVVTGSSATVSQAMLAANVAGNGPAFSVYRSTNQTGVSNNTFVKVQLNTETFDTNSNFDPSTNYRFTPTVAGYYQINGSVSFETSSSLSRIFCSIYKNGSEAYRGTDINATGIQVVVGGLVYLNGSTDYVELYGWATGTGILFYGQAQSTYLTGCLVRAA